MWAALQRILKSENSSRPGTDRATTAPFVGSSRVRSYPRLRPWHVRGRRFTTRWRGADPAEVESFLNLVASDLAAVYAELAASREETARIKQALRQWQSAQAPTAYELAHR